MQLLLNYQRYCAGEHSWQIWYNYWINVGIFHRSGCWRGFISSDCRHYKRQGTVITIIGQSKRVQSFLLKYRMNQNSYSKCRKFWGFPRVKNHIVVAYLLYYILVIQKDGALSIYFVKTFYKDVSAEIS